MPSNEAPKVNELPILYAHPFAAYCWKVLIALYENDVPFQYRRLDDPAAFAELKALWPVGKMPVLREAGATLIESSIIIEYLGRRHPGRVPLIPASAEAALEVRFRDRFFDNYVMTPVQKVVSDRMRAEGERDTQGVGEAKALLDSAYAWVEGHDAKASWATAGNFTLADCAAAPALFYADWAHPIGAQFRGLRAYRARLLAQPSVARVVEEARPFRHFFPLGAPERD